MPSSIGDVPALNHNLIELAWSLRSDNTGLSDRPRPLPVADDSVKNLLRKTADEGNQGNQHLYSLLPRQK